MIRTILIAVSVLMTLWISSAYAYTSSELQCMTRNIYWESRGEPLLGKLAVGYVVLNRAHDTGRNVCDVIYEKRRGICHFSWYCDDRFRNTVPNKQDPAWIESYTIAVALLDPEQKIRDPSRGATHFHTTSIHPYWANSLRKIRTISNHIFYGPEGDKEQVKLVMDTTSCDMCEEFQYVTADTYREISYTD